MRLRLQRPPQMKDLAGESHRTASTCPLCTALLQPDNDPCFVARLQHGTLLLNKNQIYRGRCVYVFNQHITDITDLEVTAFSAYSRELHALVTAVARVFHPNLVNLAMLGNRVRHVHWHIIPRYSKDPNWGDPPWPSETLELSERSYRQLGRRILRALEVADYETNKIPERASAN